MPAIPYQEIKPPQRILLGPGPSNVHPRVQQALMAPVLGHMDPYFYTIMEDTMSLLRYIFQTENKLTFPISATGSAGMEAGLCNFLEPGDVAVIANNGFFADRMINIAQRCGAEIIKLDAEWGHIIEPEAIEAALKSQKKVKLLALVHAETSTGVLQPLTDASQLAKQQEALFLVDAVTSCSQKCLSCPPGLSPITVNQKAMDTIPNRSHAIPSYYFDLSMLSTYWIRDKGQRAYHHTAPACMFYAMHEALALAAEEGLEARIQRHAKNGAALQAGLEAIGLTLHVQPDYRLKTLTTVRIPEGIDDARIRQRLLSDYSIEIGGGLGTLKGKVWRIGLMGYASTEQNVLLVLSALEKLLAEEGYKSETGAGVKAAIQSLRK